MTVFFRMQLAEDNHMPVPYVHLSFMKSSLSNHTYIIQIIKTNLLFSVRAYLTESEESIVAVDLGYDSFFFPIMKVGKEADKHLGPLLNLTKSLRDTRLILFRNTMLLHTRMTFFSFFKRFRKSLHGVEGHELFSALFSHHHNQPDDLR